MMKRKFNNALMVIKRSQLILLTIGSLASCTGDQKPVETEGPSTGSTSPTLNISDTIPGNLPLGSSERDLAIFAWNEFFALNWASSWTKDNKRANADASWDFATGGPAPDLAVWETYIHRSELRPTTGPLQDRSTGLPYYSYVSQIDSITNNITLDSMWNNLDEDNEIGSAYLLAYDSLEVLYMAKTNLKEYDYLKKNLPTDSIMKKAASNGANVTYLKNVTENNLSCNSDTASNVICLPCGSTSQEGAIEIKTAWRFLVPGLDSISRFMTKKVLYYTEGANGLVANEGTMALIGIHIIRKMEHYPSFVFASFEQVDVRKNYKPAKGDSTSIMNYYGAKGNKFDPHTSTPVVPRDISPTITTVNSEANSLITNTNSSSLWQYYRLIGVQASPVNYSDSVTSTDPNYFMANYVIESDSMLTLFHGSFADPFDSNVQNVVFDGKTVNMGGCQGCHGQAQVGGTDFSFILGSGAGNPISEPDVLQTVEEVRTETGDVKKLKAYIENFK